MRLHEAVESGKPFKRKAWWIDTFYIGLSDSMGYLLVTRDAGDYGPLSAEDVIADDWQVQEPQVTITHTQFLEVYSSILIAEGQQKELRGVTHAIEEQAVSRFVTKMGEKLFGK